MGRRSDKKANKKAEKQEQQSRGSTEKQDKSRRNKHSSKKSSRSIPNKFEPSLRRYLANTPSHSSKCLVSVITDGNCLFASIALSSDNEDAVTTREKIVEEMTVNRGEYEPFFTPSEENDDVADKDPEDCMDVDFDSYLKRIAEDAEWGGNMEIIACSRAFKCDIQVFSLSNDGIIEMLVKYKDDEKKRFCIGIGFDGVGHYCGVVLPENDHKYYNSDLEEKKEEEEEASHAEKYKNEERKPLKTPTPKQKEVDEKKIKLKPASPCPCGSKTPYKRCCKKKDDYLRNCESKKARARNSDDDDDDDDDEDDELVKKTGEISL